MDQVAFLKDKGNAALSDNNIDDAIKYYTEAINLDSRNAILYSNRSAAYAKACQYDLALSDAEKAIEINPKWAKAYSRKGTALLFLDRVDEAIKTFEEGLKIDPDNAQLKSGVVEARSLKAQREGASFHNLFDNPNLLAKLRADPRTRAYLDDPEYLAILKELKENPYSIKIRGKDQRILDTLGVLIKESPYQEFMETEEPQEPEPPTAQKLAEQEKEKGNACYKKKDFSNAITHYTRAIDNDPTNITYYNNLAAVYFEQKEYEKCIKECEKAIEVGRENRADFKLIAKSFTRIGNAYKKMGDYVTAKVYYEKSMSEHRTPEIKTLLSEVEKIIKEKEKKEYIDPEVAEKKKR